MTAKPLRILFIHHGEVLGGAPVSLLNTILALKESGEVEIKVLCVNDAMKHFFREHGQVEVGDLDPPCKILGKVLIGWASLFERQNLRLLFKELRQLPASIRIQREQLSLENPELIHLNSAILFTTAWAAKALHIPLVWHIREIVQGGGFNLRKRLAGWFIRRYAERVIAISPGEAHSLGQDRENKVKVVYNFVDFVQFDRSQYDTAAERKRLAIKEHEKVIVFLGGISWRKGSLEMLEAMQTVASHVKLVIAGSAEIPRKTRLSRKARILLILEDLFSTLGNCRFRRVAYPYRVFQAFRQLEPERIIFTGELKNVLPLLAAADLVASPHTFPHSSRPIFEAWAMQKPVMAFDIPGISEYIEHERDGILVTEKTGSALAEAINRVIDNETLLQRMGENGYKKAYTYFRKDVNIAEIRKIYQELSQK